MSPSETSHDVMAVTDLRDAESIAGVLAEHHAPGRPRMSRSS
jgi:hypothetical protein